MIQTEKKKNIFKGKRVLVVGLARSGIGAANLLSSFGAEVWVTDIKSQDSLRDNIKRLLPSIRIRVGEHPEEIFNLADLIIVSPGVPLNIPPLMHAKTNGIPIIGELELAYQVVTSYELQVASKIQSTGHATRNTQHATPAFIAVTGTNGKSTTTTFINLMLRKSGFKTLMGGNIGNALTEEIYSRFTVHGSRFTGIDYIVAEVSSFQLESIHNFKPFISVILNITPDHLNRYGDIQEYINAKARIFENQGQGDYLILNADDPIIKKVESERLKVKGEKPNIFYFSREKEIEGIYYRDGRLCWSFLSTSGAVPFRLFRDGAALPPFDLIAADEIKIKGLHNLENAMAASLVAFICGCPPEAIRGVLRDFPGLEHRLEFVCEIDGVSFINDSKGTNVGAVVKSLESFRNVILIMGGRDKDGDFTLLKDLTKKRVKTLILLGEAKEKIARAIGGVTETSFVKDIKEAVELSVSKASVGDVVLLSPGCASFDMFADFEERGMRFKEAVYAIKNSKSQIPNYK
jgi:UDP-N-acetylmuramoylalanine--D-glutamate ligase